MSKDNKSNINSNFSIDYSIINPNLTKILIENEDNLIKIIKHFMFENKYIDDSDLNNDVDELHKELANILSVIPNKIVLSIMYGNLLKILSTFERTDSSLNSVVNIGINLGEELINTYYYHMYLTFKSKTENKNYYLSN